jgi:hypothetical protein
MAIMRWFKSLDAEEKKKFESKLSSSKEVLNRLTEIVQQKYDESLTRSEDAGLYERPSWAQFQADQIGLRRAYKEILDLINLDRGN